MSRFAFVSRHTPTAEQIDLARAKSIDLVHVGDTDAFAVTPGWIHVQGEFTGVVVVHPAAALRLSGHYLIGVFENAMRPGEGEKPLFFAKELHIFDTIEGGVS